MDFMVAGRAVCCVGPDGLPDCVEQIASGGKLNIVMLCTPPRQTKSLLPKDEKTIDILHDCCTLEARGNTLHGFGAHA